MKADDYIKNVAYKDFNNRNLLDNLDAINQHLILDLMNKFAEAQNKELQGYVKHKTWCKLNVIGYEGKECTCGLAKLLEK